MRQPFTKQLLLIFVSLLLTCLSAEAQLNAGFSADTQGGCSPLTVHFTNTSSASSSAVYKWDFGNGNSSVLKDAGAVFNEAGTYIVTLTISDSSKTSSISDTITVFKKPSVDFDVSVQKGCVPLSTAFTYNGGTAVAAISNYYWDFGDGTTESTDNSHATHSYMNPAKAAVSLTVTDNHGCQSTLLKKDIVNVLPELIASFAPEKKVLCKITDPALFINNSTGPGTLTYQWNFGDGTTSSLVQPSHIFAAKGIYDVGLTVTSSEGCTVSTIQKNVINAADFKSEFPIPNPVCDLNTAQFDNKSFPAPDKTMWEFSDGYTYSTTGNDSVVRSFPSAITYQVKITNVFGSCSEVITEPIQVRKSPALDGFISDITTSCGSPALVNFKDTTASAVKWLWSTTGYAYMETTEKNTSYTFNYDNTYYVTLKVTDTAGCASATTKAIKIYRPKVTVSTPEDIYERGVTSCGPILVHFVVTSSDSIKTYSWDFGDGSTSNVAAPAHLYDKAGNYSVHLNYTTITVCSGTADLDYSIAIRDPVKADFEMPATVCGNTTVTINNLTPVAEYYYYQWFFGDGTQETTYWNQSPDHVDHKYNDSGYYTVTLIASNNICADTMVKKNLVKVLAPFPRISGYTNTCEGTRGDVLLTNGSTQAVSGTWNFGDGTTAPYLNQPEIKHTYNKTGLYKVVLNTTNGNCTVGDSIYVSVLLKQHPILSADKSIVCSKDDFLTLTYSNLETNPNPYGYDGYGYGGWYHTDGSFAIGQVSAGDLAQIPFTMSVWDFSPGEGLYSIVTSANFGCTDTTNTIPLTIKGPIPGFMQVEPDICKGSTTVILQDSSKSLSGVKLVSWEWNFGDGQLQTHTSGGQITHKYNYPGTYPIKLKVTDADGCYDYFYGYAHAETNSLKASFTPSVTILSPGSSVTFTNTSRTSDITNTTYKWLFGDGTGATTQDAVKVFSTPGEYHVKLIVYNNLKGCSDTASAIITVKYVNAAFAFNASYISNSKCPPVVVSFANTSLNVSKITWDFGDGASAVDVFNPSHVYTKAGRYIINVTAYSDNGTSYTTKDSVIIDEPSVDFKTNISHTCTGQSIEFNASSQNVASYTWDFGDGTINPATDSIATHQYSSAGMYIPNLIVTDVNGCSVYGNKSDTVFVDSLDVSLNNIPDKICVPKEIFFTPGIVSINGDRTSPSLTYHWNFGTGNLEDTSSQGNATFLYEQRGNYSVSLKVQSQYGCVKQVTKDIAALQGLAPFISGPSDICAQSTAQFNGSTLLPGTPSWKWIFDDGTVVNQKDPPAKTYNQPGNFTVKLVVDNSGCIDTVNKVLQVHPNPEVSLSIKNAKVCEGSSLEVSAGGGDSYLWAPSAGLNTTTQAVVTASPVTNTNYTVSVSNVYGCSNKDSVSINVIHPLTVQLAKEVAICRGNTTRLEASGAISYEWINNTDGLNNVTVPDPVANPLSTTNYTVVGIGEKQCFSDTAMITVTVNPSPVVQLGNDTSLCQGQVITLNAFNSNAIYSWQDGSTSPTFVVKKGGQYYVKVDMDKCSASDTILINQLTTPNFTLGKDTSICEGQQYVLQPSVAIIGSLLWQDGSTGPSFSLRKEGMYSLTASNQCGTYTDSVIISSGFCNILMPTGFTPNNNGLNDVFRVKYPFAVKSFHMLVYNGWGEKVFETNKMSEGWNGYWKGEPALQGVYVWVISFTDTNDKPQQLKGTVTLIR